MELENPNSLLFVKNSGEFSLCVSKNEDEVILSSELSLFNDSNIKHKFGQIIPIPNNQILMVDNSCKYSFEVINKNITISRNPKANFDHIMHEEIIESIDCIELVTDYGGKFISDN